MDMYERINANADIDISTDLFKIINTERSHSDAFQYWASSTVRSFTRMDTPR
jgi:hypothetical protein